ncbi:DUF4190 domain-containing protein [Diaphorobacter caeni]|uniref:DUF4190 domain-containing protein n=1 Tax=Diaphorobacter caeni TaxID=2784387 RepID=UPI00188EFD9C|nr:DUF4190 domain-containing protein [Diaphorobacter caeni]MBF5007231.1 DUF4190 domain-containing protein [Diaphorobacter caeni]
MSFCRGCGHQIHETAQSCPQCGAVNAALATRKSTTEDQGGSLWLPIPSLVCGLVVVVALFDPDDWDMDQVIGAIGFAVAAIVLGGISLAKQKRGSGMAIAGLILGILGLLGALGSQL